jgi:Domain of unknown function (DUF1918)
VGIRIGDRLLISGSCGRDDRICRVLEVIEEPDARSGQCYQVSWFDSGAVEVIDPGPALVLLERSSGSLGIGPGALSAQAGQSSPTPLRRVKRAVLHPVHR